MVAPKVMRPEEKENLDIHSTMYLDTSCTLFNFPPSFTPYKALSLNSLAFPLNSLLLQTLDVSVLGLKDML